MRAKSMTAVLLASLLAVTGMTGCGSQGAGTSSSGGGSSSSSSSSKESKPEEAKPQNFTITYAAWTGGPVADGSIAEKAIEEMFPGVDFVPLAFERASWKEQINTRVAGGDIPDIIFRDDRALVEQYVQQQIIRDIPVDMMKEYAPHVYEEVCEYGYDTWLSSYIDGKIYGFPSTTISNTMPFTNGIRADWLKDAGIEKVPETLEEYEEAFAAFSKDGKYALSANGMSGMSNAFAFVFGAYGIFPDKWMLTEDGTGVEYGLVSQRSKAVLETLAKWYRAGYIDPEFVTNDGAKVKQKWANGQIGYIETTWSRLIPDKEMHRALMDVNPDAEIAFAPAPIGPDGQHGFSNWGRIGGSITFGKQLEKDEDKFAICLQIMDAVASDPDLYLATHWGVENEHYVIDPEVGTPVAINGYSDSEKKAEIGNALLWGLPLPSIQKKYALQQNLDELTAMAVDTTIVDNEHYFNYVGSLLPADAKQAGDPATQLQARWMIEFITGQAPISEFDTFVAEWMAAGGEEMTAAANEVYKAGTKQMSEIESLLQ